MLLKHLAQEGRTIVCTIHQPSALVFGLFDHLYAIAEGQCIYAGATDMLVPFLSELDLICPKTYNPSDYCKLKQIQQSIQQNVINNEFPSRFFSVLEISTHDYGPHNERLVAKMLNGLNESYRNDTQRAANNYSLEIASRWKQTIYILNLFFLSLENSFRNNVKTLLHN